MVVKWVATIIYSVLCSVSVYWIIGKVFPPQDEEEE